MLTLPEVCGDIVRFEIRVQGGTLGLRHAVHGPGILEVGGLAEMVARVHVPVLGRDDHFVGRLVGLQVAGDQGSDLGASRSREGAAFAEVVLDVDDEQRSGHAGPF